MKLKQCIIAAAVSAVLLAGCSQGQDPQLGQSASADVSTESTATASQSETPSATPKVSSSPLGTPITTETPMADGGGPAASTADDGHTTSLNEFLSSGGACFSDYFPAGPLTETAMTEVQNYCANQSPGSAQEEFSRQNTDADISQCEALDPATASSGAIQYCYMEYGIGPTQADVTGPPLVEDDPYLGLSDEELADLPVTGMP